MTFSVSEFVDGYFKVIIDCLVGKSIQKINKKNATELILPAVRCRFFTTKDKKCCDLFSSAERDRDLFRLSLFFRRSPVVRRLNFDRIESRLILDMFISLHMLVKEQIH